MPSPEKRATEKMTITQWEDRKNAMLIDNRAVKMTDKVTEEEFLELGSLHGLIGIAQKPRKDWLKANGYELSRENMVNVELPSKPPKDE